MFLQLLCWTRDCVIALWGQPSCPLTIPRPLPQGGKWNYVIGLVGKPSAGKSTFFNAATQAQDERHAAAMAAHPFTTIDPNLGQAFFRAPCPCVALGVGGRCRAEHGGEGLGGRR